MNNPGLSNRVLVESNVSRKLQKRGLAVSKIHRILVADNNAADREFLSEHLTEVGYAVELALDGQDALDKVRSHLPDLILLDAMLTRISSFHVCRTLKNDYQLSRIFVLMMTPLAELGAIQRGMEAGVDDFLSKPLDKCELLNRIEAILQLRKTISE